MRKEIWKRVFPVELTSKVLLFLFHCYGKEEKTLSFVNKLARPLYPHQNFFSLFMKKIKYLRHPNVML